MGSVRQLVACRVNGQEYAFPIESVREIIRDATPVSVGHGRSAMLGVVDLRGVAMPVLDLAVVLHGEPVSSDDQASRRVVVTTHEEEVLGWLVDGVDEVIGIDDSNVEPLERTAGEHVRHVARTSEGRLVPIVDVARIVAAAAA